MPGKSACMDGQVTKMVEIIDLVKKYGGTMAVDHLSISLEAGKIYGLLGPNGAGKSTTMNIMTGYLAPTAGTVRICGHDIVNSPRAAKQKIGYLPEVPPLYPEMTVWEYLRYGAMLKQIAAKKRGAEIHRVMSMTGLDGMENRLLAVLSKGYRQRVGLAGALLGNPPVLILDEPSSGVDTRQMVEIRKLIRSLKKDRVIVYSSHVMQEVQMLCDEILVLHHGKLAASGTQEDLKKMLDVRSDADSSELENIYLKLTEPEHRTSEIS